MRAQPRDALSTGALAAYRGQRVMVWGAAGFIGRWVAGALLREGAESFLVTRSAGGEERLRTWPGLDGARIVVGDLTDRAAADAIVRAVRPAITFNLAGHGIDPAERDEAAAFAVNERGVTSLCDALAQSRAAVWRGQAIVHVGSSAEYGRTDEPLHEGSSEAPVTLYGRSKLAGTRAFTERCRSHGIPGVAARLFMVYGPGEHEHRLFPSLIRAAARGEPIELSAGTQRLDFTWVGDVADWLLRLGISQAAPGEVVNLATGRLSAVRTFVEVAATELRMDRALLRFGEAAERPGDVRYGPVSTVRLRTLTGGAPATTIVQGVRATLDLQGLTHDSNEGNSSD